MFSIKQPKEIVFGKNSAHMYKYPENSLIITSPGAKKRNWIEYLQLKTGREWNLECTICNAGNSTAIARRELKDGKITQRIFDLYEKGDRWATDVLEYNKINPNSIFIIVGFI